MSSLKDMLVERRIKAIETKIRWNLRKMLRSAKKGELNIKDLNKWQEGELLKSIADSLNDI